MEENEELEEDKFREFFYCKNCRYPYGDLFSGRKEEVDFKILDDKTFEMKLPCEGGSACRRMTVLTCKIKKVELENIDTEERIDVTEKSDEEIEKEGDLLQEQWLKEQMKKD